MTYGVMTLIRLEDRHFRLPGGYIASRFVFVAFARIAVWTMIVNFHSAIA